MRMTANPINRIIVVFDDDPPVSPDPSPDEGASVGDGALVGSGALVVSGACVVSGAFVVTLEPSSVVVGGAPVSEHADNARMATKATVSSEMRFSLLFMCS